MVGAQSPLKPERTQGPHIFLLVRSGHCFGRRTQQITMPASVSGETVAVDSTLAVAGAPGDSTDQANAGAVYVYAQEEGAWGESAKLSDPDAVSGASFGRALALQSDRLLITSLEFSSPEGGLDRGLMATYRLLDGTWERVARQSGFKGANNKFGFSLSLDGDTLAVGELSETPDPTFSFVSVYALPMSVWDGDSSVNEVLENQPVGTPVGITISHYYPPESGTIITTNSSRVSIDPQTGVVTLAEVFNYEEIRDYSFTVSITNNMGVNIERTFNINIIDVNDPPSIITQHHSFSIAETALPGYHIGWVEATDEDGDWIRFRLLDDADGRFTLREDGFTFLAQEVNWASESRHWITIEAYDPKGGTFSKNFPVDVLSVYAKLGPKQHKILGDLDGSYRFGEAVALDGGNLLVGVPLEGGTHGNTGAVYSYEFDGSNWEFKQRIEAPVIPDYSGLSFGTKIAIDGSNLLITAPGATRDGNGGQGAVYVFTKIDGIWTFDEIIDSPRGEEECWLWVSFRS